MNRTTAILAAVALLLGAAQVPCSAGAAAPVAAEGGVLFTFEAPSARTVHLAGEFNGWDPAALAMSDDDGDGVWEVVTSLQTGRTYEYKFVVDGGVSWLEDPNNPFTVDDNHGGVNTVLSVSDDGGVVLGPLEGAEIPSFEPVVDELEGLGRTLYVAIVWHQHQPKYLKDLETGEYAEPWVRMHAIKDYYDMVSILADYPAIRFTVNLTPILLTQLDDVIEGWETGGGTDAYLRMTLKDAAELDLDDKVYLLTHFFNAQWDNKINIWPRYRELKAMKGGDTREELEAAAAGFGEQDWRDLQAWFNLAWFDPDFQEGDVTLPDGSVVTVRHLIEKGEGFTEDDKLETVETQIAIMKNVVLVHREAQERGQLEVITTPFYHPILPLIHDTNLARVAMPGTPLPSNRFSYPEDAVRHVELAAEHYEGLFGSRPAGMWPGEGSVAQEIVAAVHDAGFKWMASDDQILSRSLGVSSLSARQKYQMYWAGEGDARVAMIFRDHGLSDDIGFNFGKMDGVQAANSMMRSLYSVHRQLSGDDRSYVVPIILDGENAWEWFKHDGKEFFHSWYDQMSRAPWLETTTVAGFLGAHPPTEALTRLWAGSWIGHDFATWIGEAEENRAWDYLARVRSDLAGFAAEGGADAGAIDRAFDEMYAAEGSDWFWWYGSDQESSLDGAFDEIFRGTLSNVYTLVGEDVPDFLSTPVILEGGASPSAGSEGGAGGGAMARAEGIDSAKLLNGPVLVPEGILFSHSSPAASVVHLAGEFNAWDPGSLPMHDNDGDGVWTLVVELEPGRYEYKFVVDGGAVWEPDAGNPDRISDNHGGENSVLTIE
jgi:alpha-amylase/alpha-mannosidase (GH57 family)